ARPRCGELRPEDRLSDDPKCHPTGPARATAKSCAEMTSSVSSLGSVRKTHRSPPIVASGFFADTGYSPPEQARAEVSNCQQQREEVKFMKYERATFAAGCAPPPSDQDNSASS